MPTDRTLSRFGAVYLAAVLLAACTQSPERPAHDYNVIYPIGVRVETVAVTFPLGTQPSGTEDEFRLAAFVADYLDRGHGPLTIAARADPRELRERLIVSGVPASAIRAVTIESGARDAATLRYERYVSVLPTCGDWTGTTGRNPLNDVHSNFGCAQQRNMGAMAADPADLLRMRAPAPTDTQNANRVVQRYRAGEPTAATPSPLQERGAAGTTSQR